MPIAQTFNDRFESQSERVVKQPIQTEVNR